MKQWPFADTILSDIKTEGRVHKVNIPHKRHGPLCTACHLPVTHSLLILWDRPGHVVTGKVTRFVT